MLSDWGYVIVCFIVVVAAVLLSGCGGVALDQHECHPAPLTGCTTVNSAWSECQDRDGSWWILYSWGGMVKRTAPLSEDPEGVTTICSAEL